MATKPNFGAGQDAEHLLERVRQGLSSSLRRAIRGAGRQKNGQPTRTTQVDLSKASGVARSTLAKYLNETNAELINPDLTTLCRLAYTLNISPAFLLLTSEDWRRLAHGAAALVAASRTQELENLIDSQEIASRVLNPTQQAQSGLELAKKIGVAPKKITLKATNPTDKAIVSELAEMNERAISGLLATCALPPASDMPQEYAQLLLYFCAVVGATNP